MGHIVYKDHTIVNTGQPCSPREDSKGFVAVAASVGKQRGHWRCLFSKIEQTITNGIGSKCCGIPTGKEWVDRHRRVFRISRVQSCSAIQARATVRLKSTASFSISKVVLGLFKW